MGFSDKYKNRMNRNGADLGEAYSNNTIAFIESTFHASPTFRVLGVNAIDKPHITEMDARVVEVERLGTLREILFRPSSEGLNVGTYVSFDDNTWLIFDSFGKKKVIAEQCNRTLKWIDKDANLIEIDCIASSMDLGSKAKQSRNEIEWNKYDVRLALGQLFVFVTLTDKTKEINLNQRFIFGSRVYEVVGIDDTTAVDRNGFGILQLNVKVTTIRDEDDFENRIAHNLYKDSQIFEEIQGLTGETEEEDKGGRIW
jgi:hypothetical protein